METACILRRLCGCVCMCVWVCVGGEQPLPSHVPLDALCVNKNHYKSLDSSRTKTGFGRNGVFPVEVCCERKAKSKYRKKGKRGADTG